MTALATHARRRPAATHAGPFWALVRVEAGRLLRHPAPWAAALLWLATAAVTLANEPRWPAAQYTELMAATAFLGLGVSLAAAHAASRLRTDLAEDAPLPAEDRAAAQLVAGLALVALVAVLVAGGALWLRLTGGITLLLEPGQARSVFFSLPELLQPVVVAALAVAVGAAVVRVVRHLLPASVVLVVLWFLVGPAYWVSNGPVLRWLTPVQVQPLDIWAAPPTADPTTLPAQWLLQAPGPYQDFWARITFSPALAAGHDVYLLGLTLLAAAVAVPGRRRRVLLVAGAALAVAGALLQRGVAL
jgi:hypothetical protein